MGKKNKARAILTGMSPAAKKGVLNNLISSLISGLNEAEKKEMIKSVLAGRKEGKELESMVEY